MEPQFIDVDQLLVLERVGPLSTMLVLRILPFRSNTLLEEMVVRLDREIRTGGNVVLYSVSG